MGVAVFTHYRNNITLCINLRLLVVVTVSYLQSLNALLSAVLEFSESLCLLVIRDVVG